MTKWTGLWNSGCIPQFFLPSSFSYLLQLWQVWRTVNDPGLSRYFFFAFFAIFDALNFGSCSKALVVCPSADKRHSMWSYSLLADSSWNLIQLERSFSILIQIHYWHTNTLTMRLNAYLWDLEIKGKTSSFSHQTIMRSTTALASTAPLELLLHTSMLEIVGEREY